MKIIATENTEVSEISFITFFHGSPSWWEPRSETVKKNKPQITQITLIFFGFSSHPFACLRGLFSW